MISKYLVRPSDFHIYELDESNNCYRSWSTRAATYSDGTRPNANQDFTFDNLTRNHGFFPINEHELDVYQNKNQQHHKDMIHASYASLQSYSGNWTEDFSHENGNYINMCIECDNTFLGHKRRVLCNNCFNGKK